MPYNPPSIGQPEWGDEILETLEHLENNKSATGHTHTQAQSHGSPDTDVATTSLHHTLGTGANQAAAGNHNHDTRYYTEAEVDSALAGKSNTGHTHTLANVTDAGTAAGLNVPAAGDAAVGEVVKGNDSRLTNSRTPTAHNHAAADTNSGTFDIARIPTGSTSSTVSLGNHTHTPTAAQTNEYTTAGQHTYSIPANATAFQITMIGPGGGGGSGRRGASGTDRTGGEGGGGGAFGQILLTRAQLLALGFTDTIYVEVGNGGTGGAAVTADNTNGNAGADGGLTTSTAIKLTSSLADGTNTVFYAGSGWGGAGGVSGTTTTAQGFGGSDAILGFWSGNGGQGTNGTGGTNQWYAALRGGGGGGGINTSNVAGAGGPAYYPWGFWVGSNLSAGGANTGGAGTSGTVTARGWLGGPGGGGGARASGGAGGAGGNGVRGHGGGGGGASVNGQPSGAGGNGGDGFVRIDAFF